MAAASALRLLVPVLLLAGTQAEARPRVPDPTVSWSSTTTTGYTLPKDLVSASWEVGGNGVDAQLGVSVKNPPAAVATVDALWTSTWLRCFQGIASLAYKVHNAHGGSPTSTMPAGFSYALRYREQGGAWSRWFTTSVSYSADNSSYDDKQTFVFPEAPKRQVQFQWKIHVEMTDPGTETDQFTIVSYPS